ncbi:MAG TPA: hypothetical protein DIU39_00690 [Flavobacteriales bacterium]|nr:hypothetical protein [Flavobacteriales bacterium]|tara:strand:- start:100429 stop:101097 length:669 start_codon:yes stop_codon:yes gene_type:complete
MEIDIKQMMKNLFIFTIITFSIACATVTTIGKSAGAKDFPPGTLVYINISDNITLKPIPEVPNNLSQETIKSTLYNKIKSTIEMLNGKVVEQLPQNCDNCYEIKVTSVNIASSKSTKNHTDIEKGYENYPYPYYTSELNADVEMFKTDNNDKLGSKTFYVKSYSRLQEGKLPPLNELNGKDIDDYVTRPKYDFKELTEELGDRVAYWSSKRLNKYVENLSTN